MIPTEPLAQDVWFDASFMHVRLVDGRELSVPLAWFPRLLKAESSQLKKYRLTGKGIGIHWESLDEDISVSGLLMGYGDQTVAAA